jgi:hypothetical protein
MPRAARRCCGWWKPRAVTSTPSTWPPASTGGSVGARQGVVGGYAVTKGVPCCVHRLSKFAGAEHRAVGADPRFLQLLDLAALMLKSRPKELGTQEIANMLNGGCLVSHLLVTPGYLAGM